jgi:hypothetical protein
MFVEEAVWQAEQLDKGCVLFFLTWFCFAKEFTTFIGQLDYWDILSGGLAISIVKLIGALMYMVAIFNYWKAGLTLGLLLDSFKYEKVEFFESCYMFKFEINIFTGIGYRLLHTLPLLHLPMIFHSDTTPWLYIVMLKKKVGDLQLVDSTDED